MPTHTRTPCKSFSLATTSRARTVKDRFKNLTMAQKRVAIARDVLAQLDLGLYTAGWGYGHTPVFNPRIGKTITPLSSLDPLTTQRLLLSKNRPTCAACAKGCVMLSLVRHRDGLKYDDIPDQAGTSCPREFSKTQWDMIEIAYEGFDRFLTSTHTGHEWRPDLLYSTPDGRHARLVAIMENIIKNKGTFKP